MAYNKTIWRDRVVSRPRTYRESVNADGSITHIPSEGNISEAGTPVNANNLNKIEDELTRLGTQLAEIAINIKSFGAKGDEFTDDSDSINDAIQYAYKNKIFNVFVPEGTYILNKPIVMQQHINLFGGGWRTFLRIKDNTDIDAIRTKGLAYESNISRMTIDCNKQNNSFVNGGSAINGHFDTSVIEFVRVKNCSKTAIRLNDDGSIYDSLGYLNMVRYNQIEDSDIGIKWSYRSTDSWCYYNNIGSDFCNIFVQGGPIRIEGNHFNGNPQYNMYLEGGNTILVTNNIIENAGKHAIYAPELSFNEAFKNINISNNIIRACSREINKTYDLINMSGRDTVKGNGLLISGNTLVGNNGRFPKYTANIKNVQNVSIQANIMVDGYSEINPFKFENVTTDAVGGNVPSNGIVR